MIPTTLAILKNMSGSDDGKGFDWSAGYPTGKEKGIELRFSVAEDGTLTPHHAVDTESFLGSHVYYCPMWQQRLMETASHYFPHKPALTQKEWDHVLDAIRLDLRIGSHEEWGLSKTSAVNLWYKGCVPETDPIFANRPVKIDFYMTIIRNERKHIAIVRIKRDNGMFSKPRVFISGGLVDMLQTRGIVCRNTSWHRWVATIGKPDRFEFAGQVTMGDFKLSNPIANDIYEEMKDEAMRNGYKDSASFVTKGFIEKFSTIESMPGKKGDLLDWEFGKVLVKEDGVGLCPICSGVLEYSPWYASSTYAEFARAIITTE
jgi:hypothetical protein